MSGVDDPADAWPLVGGEPAWCAPCLACDGSDPACPDCGGTDEVAARCENCGTPLNERNCGAGAWCQLCVSDPDAWTEED